MGRTIAVLTSGGDAPGMNAAVRAVAKVGAARGVHVLGVEEGYDGLIDRKLRPLTSLAASPLAASPAAPGGLLRVDPSLDRAVAIGGTILGSARCARFRTPEGRAAAAQALGDVDALVVIGGDGSLTGGHLLATEHGVRVVGIPASIDNDIGCTALALGVDTALNTIVESCDRITDTASSHRRAFVVEVMGRRSGYLAMTSAIAAAADGVLLPEQSHDEASVVSAVERLILDGFARGKRRVLVIKAEGVETPCTRLVRLVESKLEGSPGGKIEVRATVLGHLVRGGAPSYADRMLASRLALAAVDAALAAPAAPELAREGEMVAWLPTVRGGLETADPYVRRFPLGEVLAETKALLDGTSAVTRWRMGLLDRVEGALPM
jgi:6-phosphofructokinase 1